jgi:phosphoribosylformylglycinamidine synthase
VAVLGVIDDVTRRTPSGFVAPGQQIYLLGATREELSGSEWAHVVHGHLGGEPPAVDLAAERELADILVNSSRDGLVDAAHDLSEGGLAQALVEACLRYGVGARVWLDEVCERDGVSPFAALFAESTSRALTAVPRSEEVRFTDMCAARGIPFARIGVVDDGDPDQGGAPVLDVQGLFTVPLAELREAHERTLPAALEG